MAAPEPHDNVACSSSLSRPALARWPKGGRRSLQSRPDGIQGWFLSGASTETNRKIVASTAAVAYFAFAPLISFNGGFVHSP